MESIVRLLRWTSFIGYAAACALYLRPLFVSTASSRWAVRALVATFFVQTVAIAVAWIGPGWAPVGRMVDSVYFYAWLVVIVLLFVEMSVKERSIGAFLLPVVLPLIAYSLLASRGRAVPPSITNSHWFEIHVLSAFFGYSAFAVSFGAALMYVFLARQIHGRRFGRLFVRLPSLELLDHLGYRAVSVGFPLFTLSLLTGALWANQAWGAFWRWEPKETWALVTWLLYTSYLHARFNAGWQGRRAALLAIAGFTFSIVTFVGTSMLAKGKHVF